MRLELDGSDGVTSYAVSDVFGEPGTVVYAPPGITCGSPQKVGRRP